MHGCVRAFLVDSLLGHAHEAADRYTDQYSQDQTDRDRIEFVRTVHACDFVPFSVLVDTVFVFIKTVAKGCVDASCVVILDDSILQTAISAIVPFLFSLWYLPIVFTLVFDKDILIELRLGLLLHIFIVLILQSASH